MPKKRLVYIQSLFGNDFDTYRSPYSIALSAYPGMVLKKRDCNIAVGAIVNNRSLNS